MANTVTKSRRKPPRIPDRRGTGVKWHHLSAKGPYMVVRGALYVGVKKGWRWATEKS